MPRNTRDWLDNRTGFRALLKDLLEEPLPIEATPEYQFFETHSEARSRRHTRAFLDEFDRDLDGRLSKLVDYKLHNETLLADAVREVYGATREALSDDEAIELALHPDRNRLLGEALNLSTLSKVSRALFHPSYTFRKKLSHTADSQDQRHRMTPASRPVLAAHLTDEPDYVTPELVRQAGPVESFYREVMARSWEAIARLRALGVSDEFAMYLLPNSVAIRFTESADLLNLHHKHTMRLCYLAQEEIWRASKEEAEQICEVNPRIGRWLLPPCTQRMLAHRRPFCPEGERYCGVRVWTMEVSDYSRVI